MRIEMSALCWLIGDQEGKQLDIKLSNPSCWSRRQKRAGSKRKYACAFTAPAPP
jgi:hypothetical protein